MKKPDRHRIERQRVRDAAYRKHPARALAAAKHRSWLNGRELTRERYRRRVDASFDGLSAAFAGAGLAAGMAAAAVERFSAAHERGSK